MAELLEEFGDVLPQSPSGKKRSASAAALIDELVAAAGSQDGQKRAKVKGTAGDVETPASEPHRGWNGGVNNGLRTSFAASSKDRFRKQPPQRASKPSFSTPTRDLSGLVMPPADPKLMKGDLDGSAWQARFVDWCAEFMARNNRAEGLHEPVLLREAWESWLRAQAAAQGATLEAGLHAAAETNLDPEKLQEIIFKSLSFKISRDNSPAEVEQSESPVSVQTAQSTLSGQAGQNDVGSKSKKTSPQPATMEAIGNDWALPPPRPASDFEIKHKRDEPRWQERFVEWCTTLAQMNEGKIEVDTPRARNRIIECYFRWIGSLEGLSKAKATCARRGALQYTHKSRRKFVTLFSGTPISAETQPLEVEVTSPPEQDTMPTLSAVVSDASQGLAPGSPSEGDVAYLEKYFPGISPHEQFCKVCASHGHDSTDCSVAKCRFCDDPGHRSFSCPTRQRCTKCKQLGHKKEECSEKLGLAPEEVECAFCGSRDHDDASCPDLSVSFSIEANDARKVRSLPKYCSCCGRKGHFASECALNPDRRTKEAESGSWSQMNFEKYLDPTSPEEAIIYKDASESDVKSGADRPELGKSIVPKRHIFFEEDEDDDAEEFIRPPVQKSARVGHIRFGGSNGGHGGMRPSKQYNDRNRRPGYNQPPLPPGPPPPLLPSQGNQQGGRWNGGRRARGGARGSYSGLIGR